MQEQEVAKIEVGDGAAIPTHDDRGLVSAWWIALVGAVALIVLLPVIKPAFQLFPVALREMGLDHLIVEKK